MSAKNKSGKSVTIKNIFALLAIMIVAIVVYYLTDYSDNKSHPESFKYIGKNNFDEVIDVGGLRLHIHCTGSGEPTVILDSGMGMPGGTWLLVQRETEKFTRVCSYDRAGYGLSDLGPNPRTSTIISKELHALLQAAEIKSPYIMVGHSFGGENIRLFAALYPHEVAGVVLVDSAHEDVMELIKMPKQSFKEQILTFIKQHINYFGYISFKGNVQATKKPLLFTDQEWQSLVNFTYNDYLAFNGERNAIKTSVAELKQSKINLGNKPLVVITAGKDDELPNGMELPKSEIAEQKKIWLELQKRLTMLSTNSTHIFAHKSNHFVQFYEPAVIVDAIRNEVIQLRLEKP